MIPPVKTAGHAVPEAPTAGVTPFRLSCWLPLAAAAALALVAAWVVQLYFVSLSESSLLREQQALGEATLRSVRNQLEAERLLANRQLQDATQAIAALERQLREPGDLTKLQIVSLNSPPGSAPRTLAVAVWNHIAQEGILWIEKLPAAAPGQDYQLWVFAPPSPLPVDGGVFTVDACTGEVRYQFKAGQPVKNVTRFAVSLGRKGGVPQPEGPMVLISH